MTLRNLYYLLSPKLRRLARRIYYLPIDFYEVVSDKRPELVPPKGLIFTGAGDFVKMGDVLLDNFISTCNLKPEDRVLDIGCGIGRVARPLTKYLNQQGSYEGFDVVKDGIDWCRKHYRLYKNFNFKYIPLKNDLYNLSTKQVASGLKFPYHNEEFDLVVLTSVFTHMQYDEVKNYISEIARVLKPGKHCFCTFFLITPESDLFLSNATDPLFKYKHEDYYLHHPTVKDANIAYKYEVIEKMANDSGLKIKNFFPGWWVGKSKNDCMNFQDVLVLTK